jgi:hypothetical protein
VTGKRMTVAVMEDAFERRSIPSKKSSMCAESIVV